MQHHRLVLVVNVVQACGDIPHDAVAGVPLPDGCILLAALQLLPEGVLVQAAVRHVLVDK